LPSQTAHRLALPYLGFPEQFSIAVSSWLYSSLFVDRPSFTVALHDLMFRLRQFRLAAQLNVGNRQASKGRHGAIRRFMARTQQRPDGSLPRGTNPSPGRSLRAAIMRGQGFRFGEPAALSRSRCPAGSDGRFDSLFQRFPLRLGAGARLHSFGRLKIRPASKPRRSSLTTARALGLTVPQTILATADDLIN
jgi:hypothetical protein